MSPIDELVCCSNLLYRQGFPHFRAHYISIRLTESIEFLANNQMRVLAELTTFIAIGESSKMIAQSVLHQNCKLLSPNWMVQNRTSNE